MSTYHHLSSFKYVQSSFTNPFTVYFSGNRPFFCFKFKVERNQNYHREPILGTFWVKHSLVLSKTNFSAVPAPYCPVGFGEEDSVSFRPTLCGCEPGRFCTDRRLLETNQGHLPLQEHNTEDVLRVRQGWGEGVLFLLHP